MKLLHSLFARARTAVALPVFAAALLMTAPGSSRAAEVVKIGFIGPLSGSLSLLGQGVRDGLTTYIDYVNDHGGVNGRKIELVAEDDGYEPMRALAAAKKLVDQDKVLALVSPVGTPSVSAILSFAQDNKLPIIAPYAFSHALTSPVKPYVFTTLPEVRLQSDALGGYLVNTLKQRKIASIYQNDDFGQDAVAGLEERLKKENVPLTKVPFDRGSTNFSGVVAQAQQSGATEVVFLGIPRDAALIMRQARQIGWSPQFSGHNALGDPQTFTLAGKALVEGTIAVGVMEPLDSTNPQVVEFVQNQKKYLPKTSPTTYSLHGYNAGVIFVEALKRVKGGVTADKLVAALETINNLDTGMMGPITYTKTRHAGSQAVRFLQAKDGKWVFVSPWINAEP